MEIKKRSPWAWIPTLYFAQGIPYVVAMTVAVIMYKRLGISNTEIALYTSWLYLPWVIKPFWSPFVDLVKTKRWWIVTMQTLVGAGLAAVAFLIPASFYFQATLAILWLIAFSSATHDIAADGFYMLALNSGEQAYFVGIRSTFYRFATIFGQGLLIMLAGFLESSTGLEPIEFQVKADPSIVATELMAEKDMLVNLDGEMMIQAFPEVLNIPLGTISLDSLASIKSYVHHLNVQNGFEKEIKNLGDIKTNDESWWTVNISDPLKKSLQTVFGVKTETEQLSGNVGIVAFKLNKCPKEGDEVVLNVTFKDGDKDISLVSADRLVFTSENWDKPAYAAFAHDYKLQKEANTEFEGLSGNIPLAWSITFFILAGLFIAFFLYHRFILPYPSTDKSSTHTSARFIMTEFIDTFVSFFKKPGIGIALCFMLLYRLGEAMLVKMSSPFLLDAREIGGMGLTTGEVGLVYGTVGVICLTLGGILGGLVVSKRGLKFWMWPMALCITLPHLAYLFLTFVEDPSFITINIAVAIEQFGYGFGFTAYMLYLILVSEGEHKTAHYALCTGFMALGMMLPGMIAGWLQEAIGYQNFFIFVMICAIPTLAVIPFLKIPKEFGRK